VFISAQQKENIEALREMLGRKVAELYQVRYPYSNNQYGQYDAVVE
jgi:GTP-binding protein HflX